MTVCIDIPKLSGLNLVMKDTHYQSGHLEKPETSKLGLENKGQEGLYRVTMKRQAGVAMLTLGRVELMKRWLLGIMTIKH